MISLAGPGQDRRKAFKLKISPVIAVMIAAPERATTRYGDGFAASDHGGCPAWPGRVGSIKDGPSSATVTVSAKLTAVRVRPIRPSRLAWCGASCSTPPVDWVAWSLRRAPGSRPPGSALRGARGGLPPGSALRGARGGRPPGSALRGAPGGRPPGAALLRLTRPLAARLARRAGAGPTARACGRRAPGRHRRADARGAVASAGPCQWL